MYSSTQPGTRHCPSVCSSGESADVESDREGGGAGAAEKDYVGWDGLFGGVEMG